MAVTNLDERYARLRSDLLRAVNRVCPPWLHDRKEDLVQTALIRVLEVERRGEGKAEFSSLYLRKAAYSALVDELRRLRRRREVSLDDENPLHGQADHSADPERISSAREVGSEIQVCLQRLVRPRRQAAILFLQGHSVPETGRLLGWSVKRAENLVYRGLADLRACLRARGAEP